MSIGLEFLYSCVTSGARADLRTIPAEVFIPEEEPSYRFVLSHLTRFNVMPSPDICTRNGFPLVVTDQPPEYSARRLRMRRAYTTFDEAQRNAQPLMRARNMVEVVQTMQSALNRMRPLVLMGAGEVMSMEELAEQVMADYEEAHLNPGRQGITLGWDYLDEKTNGAEGGDVVTIVARPNIGKSWVLTHMARQAWREGANVLFVTMEMTGKQMVRRAMGLDAGINPNYIREGRLSQFGMEAIQQTMTDIRTGAPFNIIQGSFNKSLDTVDAAIEEFAPDIVYIDASYLMAPSKAGSGGRKQHEVLAMVGTEMKEMAMARNKPFVQTVQFNREAERVEQRGLAQIGGTDVVGQISTVVVGLDFGPMPSPESSRRATIYKNRENPLGEWLMNFLFNPPNFRHRPPEDVAPENNGGVEAEWTL